MSILSIPNAVHHTLPAGFYVLSHGKTSCEVDVNDTTNRAYVHALAPEGWRLISNITQQGTPTAPTTFGGGGSTFYKALADNLYNGQSPNPYMYFGLNGGPDPRPNSGSAVSTTNFPSAAGIEGSTGTSAAWLTYWQAQYPGHVRCVEYWNEPANTSNNPSPAVAKNWFADVANGGQKGEDFANVHARYWKTALAAVIGQTETQILLGHGAHGDSSSHNGFGAYEAVVLGKGFVAGWPHPDDNIAAGAYTVLTFHAYAEASGNHYQDQMNAMAYPLSDSSWTVSTGLHRHGFLATFDFLRTVLNGNGGSAIPMGMSEWEPQRGFGRSGLGVSSDAMLAVAAANRQAAWNLQFCCWMDLNRDTTSITGGDGDQFLLAPVAATGNKWIRAPRYWGAKDVWGKFLKTYKNICRVPMYTGDAGDASWATPPGVTDGGTFANPVQRHQAVVGFDSAGNMAVLVTDLGSGSAAEQITLKLPWTPTAAKVIACPNSQTLLADATFPTTTSLPVTNKSLTTGASGVPTLNGGDTMLFEFTAPPQTQPQPTLTTSPAATITATQTGYQAAVDNGAWTNTPTSYSYQWQADTSGNLVFGNVAAHGTASTYIVSPTLVGCNVRCLVTATNSNGSSVPAASSVLGPFTQGPLDPGVRADESPLSQDGNWAATTIQNDASLKLLKLKSNGIHANDAGGAICQCYRTDVSSSDVGLVQTMTATGGAGYSFSLWCRIQNPHNVSTMAGYLFNFTQGTGWRMFKCTGGSAFAQLGSTVGTPVPTNGMVQKLTCVGTSITGWTSVDNGATFTPVITVTDSSVTGAGTIGIEMKDGTDALALNAFDQVAVAAAPVNQTAPVVSGGTDAGSTLTTTDGTWANGTTLFAYQWKRGASTIVGATNPTYTTVQADVASAVKCTVTATNANGSTPQDSNGITVTQPGPVNLAQPMVTGRAVSAGVLATDNGTWDFSPTSYAYQWKKDTAGNLTFANITSATSASYTVQAGDVGCNIKCVVTATNTTGSTPADSNIVGPVSSTTGELIGSIPI